MSIAIKANGTEYPAERVDGVLRNSRWDGRDTKAVTLEMTYAQAAALFVDGLDWSIVQREEYPVYGENGEATGETTQQVQEYANGDYCAAGPITDNRDGTVTCMMGKKTELEKAQAALAELEAAYDNG